LLFTGFRFMTGMLLACPHRPPCPGCPRFGEPGISLDAAGALAALCREAGLPPPTVVEGAPLGYRIRARLAVRGRAASPKLGIFQEGSHRIVDIPRCVVHHPAVNTVAASVKDAVRATGVAPYADRPHRGVLRYVQVVVERASGRAQVVLVANASDPIPLAPVASHLQTSLGGTLHSVWWNGNPERTNVILGPHWHRWSGPEAVEETIGGARVFFPPGAFGQANLDLADRIVAQVHAWVPDGARVVELYAGCGAVGLGLLPRVAALAFIEASPDAVAGLRLGLAAAPDASRATVLAGPAVEHLGAFDGADVVIADPPRKGLDRDVVAALVARPPARLVVVSCNLDAFLAEARALVGAGTLALRACIPYALFPQTAHVETLALFERTPAC
jgi:tRNA/tmRNA/rRNA uracil-C5-methylase (TrmA/RlmC/RlmD family)